MSQIITKETHPNTWEACNLLLHEIGEDGRDQHTVPDGNLAEIEALLARLTSDQFREFVTGDFTNMSADLTGYDRASDFLDEYLEKEARE